LKVLLRIFILFFLCGHAQADSAASDRLNQFFTGLKTLSANFEQSIQNSQLNAVERASGKLWIQRPGKFRWNYDEPYLQEIVSNGDKIWIFDADLEQVTIKKVSKALGNTPALLLSNDRPIDESFLIQQIDDGLSLSWVELKPKDDEAGFNNIRLGFEKSDLKEMLLEDNLGQTTRLIFSQLKRNDTLSSELFQFVPPKNADVFDSSK